MPRPTQQRISQTPEVRQERRPVEAPIAARRVDAVPSFVNRPRDPLLEQLTDALKDFNPALMKYAEAKGQENEERGAADRATGQPQEDDPGESYVKGYMGMDGQVKGMSAYQQIRQAYDTEFDKDNDDLEGFLQKQTGKHAQGLPDGPFKKNFEAVLAPALGKLRTEHLDYQRKQVVGKVESNAMQILDAGIRNYMEAGQPVPDDFLEGMREHLGGDMGVSSARYDQLLFEVSKRIGDEGNFSIYDMFKRVRPDGSPGMYFNPTWKEQLDQAQLRAFRVHEQRTREADEAVRKGRDQRREELLAAVFLTDDPAKAAAAFDLVVTDNRSLFHNASDVIKWRKALAEYVDGKPDVRQLETEARLLGDIYKGNVTSYQTLIESPLTRTQRTYLMGELRRMKADAERDGREAVKVPAVFKSPEYRAHEEYLKGVLEVRQALNDVLGDGVIHQQRLRAAALLEFNRRVAEAKPADVPTIADDIIKRYLPRFSERPAFMGWEASRARTEGLLRFRSVQEIRQALTEGKINDQDAMLQARLLAAQPSRSQGAGK